MISQDQLLADLQADIAGRLLSDEFLIHVPIIERDKGNIENQIENALAGHLQRDPEVEKSGAFIAVQAVDITDWTGDTPNPLMSIVVTLECSEAVDRNRGEFGTGITAQALAARVVQLLHFVHIAGAGTSLRLADGNPITTLALPAGQVGYEVRLQLDSTCFATVADVAQVIPTLAAGEITATCATAGASIYFTTDGSYPGKGNAQADLYTGPIEAPTPPYRLRFAAQKTGLNASKYITEIIGS